MLCCDDTLRSLFATCTSCGLVRVVGRSRLKTIQLLVFCSSKRLNFERMVVLFKDFFFFYGELNATEIPQNIIEMFVVRVYFG